MKPVAILLLLYCFLQQPVFAFGFYGKYLPFSKRQLGATYPQRKIIDNLTIPASATKNVINTSGGITAKVDDDCVLTVSGIGPGKKPWQIKDRVTAAGGSVWQTDLDGNGHQDLIIVLFTAGCGISPPTRLVFVMFDKSGRPSVFEITGFFCVTDDGIEDLRKVPGIKLAVLIEQCLAYESAANKNYWKTSVWRADSTRSWASMPSFAGTDLPCYVLFAFKENHKRSILAHKTEVDNEDRSIVRRISK